MRDNSFPTVTLYMERIVRRYGKKLERWGRKWRSMCICPKFKAAVFTFYTGETLTLNLR